MTLSPEREQVLAALSLAGAFCGECGFEPGETGCADCVRVREMYADAVMPILGAVHGKALRDASKVADEAGAVYAARGDNDRAGAAFAVMEQLVAMAEAAVPAAGEPK
jgi:hypothetical protein